jgi:phosphonate transport system substrate-binding protein
VIKRRSLWFLLFALIAVSLLAIGCQRDTVVGTERRPIQLYFVPSVEVAVIIESGEAIAEYLEAQTGYAFEVRVPTTYSAVVEEMGAAEGDVMAFIPAMGYVLAADRYGVDVALATVRYGWGFYWAQYLVACDSDITSLEELDGRSWAYPDTSSTSGYLVPASYFVKHGIEPGERVVAGGHPQAVTAVYEGQADFATTFYSPPGEEGEWEIGDPPQPAGEIVIEEDRGSVRAHVNGMRIRDARTGILGVYQDVLDRVCILAISDPIPNDTVSFGAGFPAEARERIVQALLDYAETEEGFAVLSNAEFYDITGFTRVDDSFFDPIRDMIDGLGLREEDILQ